MADALSVIPTAVLRNLSDKLYEKRKNAAHEIEEIVKQLAMAGDHDKITTMMNLLTNEFTSLPQANHRKVILVLVFVSLIVLVDWIVKFVVLVLCFVPVFDCDLELIRYGGDMSSAKATLESETRVGVLPMDESKVTMKGRLGPGMMIAVDLESGQVAKCVEVGLP
ncbi:hypothetical protein Syun_023892 [Stephania yunnanensis]|uniref:Glutamine amidotransferase type-2 domain-containing protein n=1 Tax=Stephania yunnanensis TaxID=152371 RepID=A0AAP0I3K7_9MAGN